MAKLSTVHSHTKITEANTVIKQIIKAYENGEFSGDTYLTPIFDELIPLQAIFTSAINMAKAESLLEDYDIIRDDSTRGFYFTLTGASYSDDMVVKKAADYILAIFSKYTLSMINEGYAIQSSLLNSLLEELEEAIALANIAKIATLDQKIMSLTNAQANFENARFAFEKNKGKDALKESATALKKSLLFIVNKKLIIFLQAMSSLGETKYAEFTNTIIEIVEDNNIDVKKRGNSLQE